MMYILACAAVLWLAYLANILYITVFYHRALTHGAITLKPWLRWWVVNTGNWITGLDPKGWCCMHRLHHQHSDTAKDPHSPVQHGVFPLMLAQLHSYERILVGLARNKPEYTEVVKDLDFPISWMNRKRMWWLPYATHGAIALTFGLTTGWWLMAAAYWVGIMSHPIQGWMVNSFGHRFGYRNFEMSDNSRNNTIVAWLVFGEGYQNNHHFQPASARFSVRWFEIDAGYWLAWIGEKMRVLDIERAYTLGKSSLRSYKMRAGARQARGRRIPSPA